MTTRMQIFMACVYRKSVEMESEDREHDLGVSMAVSSHHDTTLPPPPLSLPSTPFPNTAITVHKPVSNRPSNVANHGRTICTPA